MGCNINNDHNIDLNNKLYRFQYICGTIHQTISNNSYIGQWQYLHYCTVAKTGSHFIKIRIQTAEMEFQQKVIDCTQLDKLRNEDVRQDLDVHTRNDTIQRDRQQWKNNVQLIK